MPEGYGVRRCVGVCDWGWVGMGGVVIVQAC